MDYVNSYEIIALLMLFIVYAFYVYYNWLDLKRNRFFYSLLITTIFVTAIDAAGRFLIADDSGNMIFWAMIVATIANLGVHLISFQLYAYYLGTTGQLQRLKSHRGYISVTATVLLCVALLTNVQTHFIFWYDQLRVYRIGPGMVLLLAWTEVYLLGGSQVIVHNRNALGKKQWKIMLAANTILILTVPLQFLIPTKFRMTFYIMAGILVLYYITMHMADRHLVQTSKCFSRVGLRRVVEEKEHYRQNFVCVSINLTNINSIISVCSEREQQMLHEMIGRHLRRVGNHHGIYRIHGSEYILMCKDRKMAEEYCAELRQEIPAVFRINGKNLNLACSYYIVEFAEVSYRTGDFYRVMAGLRRVACDLVDRSRTVYYEGEVRKNLQRELKGIQQINEALGEAGFTLEFLPIFSTRDGLCRDLEVLNVIQLEDGYRIAGEALWKIALENGTLKKAGLRYFEDAVSFAKKNFLFQQGIDLLHVNVVPRQISTKELVEEYCDILLTYQIQPEQIVMEVFMDESVPEDILQEMIAYMQKKGFSVLLDQFGVNVCNLKNVLSFPFDQTKINARMAARFLEKETRQLYHLTHMLQEQNWEISMDGVESLERREELGELGIRKIQGTAICDWLSEEKVLQWLKREGGSEDAMDAV